MGNDGIGRVAFLACRQQQFCDIFGKRMVVGDLMVPDREGNPPLRIVPFVDGQEELISTADREGAPPETDTLRCLRRS